MKNTIDEKGVMFCKRADQAFNSTERRNSEAQWSNIADYILPSQSGQFVVNKTTSGEKRTQNIFDSSSIKANQELAAAIGSTLTNPAVKWSSLKFSKDDLNKNEEAVLWLENANKIMHIAFNESNFYKEVAKNYPFYTALGNMILLEEEKDLRDDSTFSGFQFKAVHLAEIAWSENKEGVVDTVFRKFRMTARQAVEKFDNTLLSDKILTAYEKNPDQTFPFLHCVYPREKKDIKKGTTYLTKGEYRPFASLYLDETSKQIVDEDGYYEFPFFVVRAETAPGEIYGFGPGHIAIPDTRTLNELTKLDLLSLGKAISPPLLISDRASLGVLDLRAEGVNVVSGDLNNAARELTTSARYDVSEARIEKLRSGIRGIFYLDQLLLPQRPEVKTEMTAYEISQRVEQMQRVMGPLLNPLLFEFLTPIVLRSFNIMLRGGAFGKLPPALQKGMDVEIVFINQLARSQRIDDVNAVQTWLNHVAIIAQMDPTALDLINSDFLVTNAADVLGAPKMAIKNEEEVKQLREQRAKMQQEQMQLESQVKQADVNAKNSRAGGGMNGGQ